MKNVPGQMGLYDCFPTAEPEPGIGEWIEKTGAVIPHIMIPGYIGKKVAFWCGTESMPNLYKVGILEDYFPHEGYYRCVIFTGKKQRSLVTRGGGSNIYEPLPWNAYPERMAAIGRRQP